MDYVDLLFLLGSLRNLCGDIRVYGLFRAGSGLLWKSDRSSRVIVARGSVRSLAAVLAHRLQTY